MRITDWDRRINEISVRARERLDWYARGASKPQLPFGEYLAQASQVAAIDPRFAERLRASLDRLTRARKEW
jgi:hypothetical protein